MLRSWRSEFRTWESLERLPETLQKLEAGLKVMTAVEEEWKRLQDNTVVQEVRDCMGRIDDLECQVEAYKALNWLLATAQSCASHIPSDLNAAYAAYKQLDQCTESDLLRDIQQEQRTTLRNSLSTAALQALNAGLEAVNYPLSLPLSDCSISDATLHPLQSAFQVYLSLEGAKQAANLLTSPIEARLQCHFRSSVPTNRLDKPEWLFKYTLTALACNLEFLFSLVKSLSSGPILDLRRHFISTIQQFVEAKCEADTKEIALITPSSDSAAYLLHYIEEAMKFDCELKDLYEWNEGGVVKCLVKDQELLGKWLEIDVKFVLIQFESEFEESKAPWDLSNVSAHVYSHLRHTIALLETIFTRYTLLIDLNLKELLLTTVSRKVIPLYFDRCSDAFQQLRNSVIAYDSNQTYWADIVARLCALHQTITTFQEFVASLPVNVLFSGEIVSGNAIKSGIEGAVQHLFIYSLSPLLSSYKLPSLTVMTELTPSFAVILHSIGGMQSAVLRAASETLAKHLLTLFAAELLEIMEKDLKTKESRMSEEALRQFKYDAAALRNLLVVDLDVFLRFEETIDSLLVSKTSIS
jgi:hypothetical protein